MSKANITTESILSNTLAQQYFELGYCPIPLPQNDKYPPAKGCTGGIPNLTAEQIADLWENVAETANVGLRCQEVEGTEFELLGIDIDQYEGKSGWHGFNLFCASAGMTESDVTQLLNSTYRTTRREPELRTGIFWYLVPAGKKWKTVAGADVEIIQSTHRYSVAPGSTVDGLVYKVYDGLTDAETALPRPEALPVLPEELQAVLLKSNTAKTGAVSKSKFTEADKAELQQWLQHNSVEPEAEIEDGSDEAELLAELTEALGSARVGGRHDTIKDGSRELISKIVEHGYTSAFELIERYSEVIEEVFKETDAREGTNRAETEQDLIYWAISRIKGNIEDPDDIATVSWKKTHPHLADEALPDFSNCLTAKEDLEPVEPNAVALYDAEEARANAVAAIEDKAEVDYWDSHGNLRHIEQTADKAGLDRYALLFRVLTVMSANMPPQTYLHDFEQPLTLYSAVIAESGAGKGVLDIVADRLVGNPVHGVLSPGTGNVHTLLTLLGDFVNVEDGEPEPIPQRMLIAGNELAAWSKMQGNDEWGGVLADVFDGKGVYTVRDKKHKYNFGVSQHSLALTFSVQPDAAHHLFRFTGRGLPGRFLISALPERTKELPADFDIWSSDGPFVEPFDPANDVTALTFPTHCFIDRRLFFLSTECKQANANFKLAWDSGHGKFAQMRAEGIFSQIHKVRLRLAVLLAVLLDLIDEEDGKRVVPIAALKAADFFLDVSVVNTRYAKGLADAAERSANSERATARRRAENDAEMKLAKENVLEVIAKAKDGKAGLGMMNNRKVKTKDLHEEAVAELLAEGKIIAHENNKAYSYSMA